MEGTALPSGCLVVIKNTNKDLYVNTDIEFGKEGDIKDLIFNKNSKSVKPKCSSESACICRSGSALSACENDAGKQPNEVSCSCGNDICDYTNPFCTKSSTKGFCSPTQQCKDKIYKQFLKTTKNRLTNSFNIFFFVTCLMRYFYFRRINGWNSYSYTILWVWYCNV